MNIAFFGSSLVSAYWNGAATYYRGSLRDLAARGHRITFYEPDAFDRQQHRDIAARTGPRSSSTRPTKRRRCAASSEARGADVVVKASGVGVFDDAARSGVLEAARAGASRIFWDVDAPATLDRMQGDAGRSASRALSRATTWC